jgi:hypothetical protein
MYEHQLVVLGSDGEGFRPPLTERQSKTLGDIQTQGWELVSSSVLMDGAIALFWKRPAPRGDDTRRIPTTYL